MKKMFITIIVLSVILLGMVIYKNVSKTSNNISIEEIQNIETYITKIYMWKEITKEALPEFDNINSSDDLWTWEVVKKNTEEYELSYEEIEVKSKEIFGPDFTKEFPKEGSEFLIYNEETRKYMAIGMGLDEEEDSFLLDKIERTSKGYEVGIVEYLEDYSNINFEGNSEYEILVKNSEGETIGNVKSTEEGKTIELVKQNIDKFTKKKVTLIKDSNGNIFVQKVERM